MPFFSHDGFRLFYRLEGRPGLPVVVLSHSIGTDHGMWEPQISGLLHHFQILRYDTRGHGASDSPEGEYSVEQLGRDALALLDHLGIAKAAWCGLSMGGAVGQWVALYAADRLTHLVLANTSPKFGDRANWDTRIKMVREGGMSAVVNLALQRFLSDATLKNNSPYVGSIRSVLLGTQPGGYIGCCAALRDCDFRKDLGNIHIPSLIIVGDRDISTPWSGHGELLAREIPGAKAVHVRAAHLSNLEQPRSFTAALLDFLLPADGRDAATKGLEMRRAVLGDDHVDRAIANATTFTKDFQDLITRYAWGTIWTRPLADQRTRRLLVLAMMAALGRWEEFRMHVARGVEHELESCDLQETLLMVAIYAGVPAANTAFHIASEEIELHNRPTAGGNGAQ